MKIYTIINYETNRVCYTTVDAANICDWVTRYIHEMSFGNHQFIYNANQGFETTDHTHRYFDMDVMNQLCKGNDILVENVTGKKMYLIQTMILEVE